MKTFGILAYPAGHSRSPEMHNAAFRAMGMNAEYVRFEISPGNLSSFFASEVRTKKIQGLSVSIPHKESVIEFLDDIDEMAKKIGSVNTIFWKEGKLVGTNTDAEGFLLSLEEFTSPKGKNILVCGAGGASRAIIYALKKAGAKNVLVWNRTPEKAGHLAKEFGVQWEKSFTAIDPQKIDIVVNTTSLGMHGKEETFSPVPKDFWTPEHIAFDIVYTPKETPFLRNAKEAGAFPISGEKMLLFQGVAQSNLFTEQEAPFSAMEKALFPEQTILEKIFGRKRFEVWEAKKRISTQGGKIVQSGNFVFQKMIRRKKENPLLIAEIKPNSPSKGALFRDGDTVESVASLYEKNGADAISVLTDEKFFGGSLQNLERAKNTVSLPLLRKDFLLEPFQIRESRANGADAVLLMRSILSAKEIEKMLVLCRSLGMDALVEVHDETELDDILANTSAEIIGINNRNLKTMKIDPETFFRLTSLFAERLNGKLLVAESGLSSREDIELFAKGADAVLIGTGILEALNREEKVRELSGKE